MATSVYTVAVDEFPPQANADATSVLASERLTGALLDRLTHHVHILKIYWHSYRLKQSEHRQHVAQAEGAPDTLASE